MVERLVFAPNLLWTSNGSSIQVTFACDSRIGLDPERARV